MAYTEDSEWRNRNEFLRGRKEIVEFLRRKWAKELDYCLKKTPWCHNGNRIAGRWNMNDTTIPGIGIGRTGTSCGSLQIAGLCSVVASINDAPIQEKERRIL